MFVDRIESPIGTIHLAVRGDALCALTFDRPLEGEERRTPISDRLRAYLAGDISVLDAIEVDPKGTPYQQSVWKLLREIPPAKTVSYAELAARLGSSPRAVGSANGANPIALVIPCHRVIAKSGDLCGYAYGLDRKRWLLQHELTSSQRAPARARTA